MTTPPQEFYDLMTTSKRILRFRDYTPTNIGFGDYILKSITFSDYISTHYTSATRNTFQQPMKSKAKSSKWRSDPCYSRGSFKQSRARATFARVPQNCAWERASSSPPRTEFESPTPCPIWKQLWKERVETAEKSFRAYTPRFSLSSSVEHRTRGRREKKSCYE